MINLSVLSYKDKIEIDEDFTYDEEYLSVSKIKRLDKVHAKGLVFQNELDEYKIRISVNGTMVLSDSVTLEDINYDFAFDIDDVIDENCIKNENMLDINELLWQNIVLEVPIRYTKSDADNLKGDNWEVKTEGSNEEVDPRMAKLLDYYKGGE